MSGKGLPDHCSKSGPAFCAWQFPNVSMNLATDAKSYAEKWSVKPGFLDPFHVVYQCVKRLKGCTYVNVKYSTSLMHKTEANKNYPSPGLQLYLSPMKFDDQQVNNDVIDFISNGSAENLTAVIRKYKDLQKVLLFLMKYLKERGQLMKFKYNSIEILQNVIANPRYLVTTFLNTVCEYELEFQAAVVLGDYLNFVVYCAFAHDLYWLKDLIVDIWAPLLIDFVNVGENAGDTLTDALKIDKRRLVMSKIIDTIPWEKVKNVENFKVTINPDVNDAILRRKMTEQASLLKKLTTMPSGMQTLNSGENVMKKLGDLVQQEATTNADYEDPVETANKEARAAEKKKKEAADKARLAAEAENQDFSYQYGYSKDYLEKNAPHGMCKCGSDITL